MKLPLGMRKGNINNVPRRKYGVRNTGTYAAFRVQQHKMRCEEVALLCMCMCVCARSFNRPGGKAGC